jgi:hypothetical protein
MVSLRRRVDASNPSAKYAAFPMSMYFPSINILLLMQEPVPVAPFVFCPYTRINTSRHCIFHSFFPSNPLTHSYSFAPFVWPIRPRTPSTAFLTIACAVWFAACASTPAVSTKVPFNASSAVSGASGGSNHGVWKSNSATTRMNRRSEQYTHGRFRKYVADMKRTRYTGEALVRRLQSWSAHAAICTAWSQTYRKKSTGIQLLKQNMVFGGWVVRRLACAVAEQACRVDIKQVSAQRRMVRREERADGINKGAMQNR